MSFSVHQSTTNLILYGIGTICNDMVRIWQIINPELFNSILCFSDSRPETWGSLFLGKPVISPEDIRYQNYYKIIITSEKYSDEIYHLLLEQYQIPSDKIIAYPPAGPYEPLLLPKYKLYMENNISISEYCIRNWFLDKAADVQVVHKGFIVPCKKVDAQLQGGVYNENGEFIAGHVRDTISRSFFFDFIHSCPIPSESTYIKETVVYGGLLFYHFGHMVTESLARLWWYLANPDNGYRFAFLTDGTGSEFNSFLHMLGLTEEKILIIDKPMQFDTIIIPEQATVLRNGGYREQALNVYNVIRDSVVPSCYEKVYLTRSKLNIHDRLINEEYFEDHFRSLGYEVIAPELLTLKEQIALMAGAKYIACTGGTLSHNILFSQDGVFITILCRSPEPLLAQYWINQAKRASCTMIDVSMSLLTNIHRGPSHLLFPTIYWRRYLQDEGIPSAISGNAPLSDFAPKIIEYISQWATRWMETSLPSINWFPKFPQNALFAYMIIRLYWESNEENESYALMKHRLYLRMGVDFWTPPSINE